MLVRNPFECQDAGIVLGCRAGKAVERWSSRSIGASHGIRIDDRFERRDSQDKAAVYLIRQRGALDEVKAGNFDAAIATLSRSPALWASLPGANVVGQGMRRLDDLRAAYTDAGGSLA